LPEQPRTTGAGGRTGPSYRDRTMTDQRTSDPATSDAAAAEEFVRAHTVLAEVPGVPGLLMHQADDAIALWERTEHAADGAALAPPFWAFAWAGGQAVARHLVDAPDTVADRRVLDFACGGGVVALAAARAGAASVLAVDIDRYAIAATRLNAAANALAVDARLADLLDGEPPEVDVVLAGDVSYSREMTARVFGFLDKARARGADVLIGDPGRAYLPRERLVEVGRYTVPVPLALEDATSKSASVWRLAR
jgi:predicted nicotinamide N-methyase